MHAFFFILFSGVFLLVFFISLSFNLNLALSGISCQCLYSLHVSLPLTYIPHYFFLLGIKKLGGRVRVNWHAHCNHVGVNVVCIDAVYKCCIKKKIRNPRCSKAQALTIAQTLIYPLQKVFLFRFFFFSFRSGRSSYGVLNKIKILMERVDVFQ